MRLLFKYVASNINVVQPIHAASFLNVADERVPRLHQSEIVSLSVAVEPSMSEKDIDLKLMLSVIISRSGVKTMDP